MSFIRCDSNPEGLYVWHETSGRIRGLLTTECGPDKLPRYFTIDLRSWGQLKRHYREKNRMHEIPFRGKHLIVESAEISNKTGRELKPASYLGLFAGGEGDY